MEFVGRLNSEFHRNLNIKKLLGKMVHDEIHGTCFHNDLRKTTEYL